MKKISSLLDSYTVWKKTVELQKLERTKYLKEHIKKAKSVLHNLRLQIRDFYFESKEDEIKFFKYLKPEVCADLIVSNAQLNYIVCKPKSTIQFQKDFIKENLKKLESQKRKNINIIEIIMKS